MKRKTIRATNASLNNEKRVPPCVDIDRIYSNTVLLYGGGRNAGKGRLLRINRPSPRAFFDQE